MQITDEPQMGHLDRMTDCTGLIQHAIYCVPRRESGYTIDDNARALRLCVRLWSRRSCERMLGRVTLYLSLLEYARRPVGGFHNLMSYQRQWLDTDAGGDCQGQAVRALAEVLASSLPEPYLLLARELISSALPTLAGLRSLRAQAYVVLACGRLWEAKVPDIEKVEELALAAAQNLVECYQRSRRPGWNWFESRMTYANAVLPHAMLIAAGRWPDAPFFNIGCEALKFLEAQTTLEGVFWPIGNNGWYSHSEPRARYDQQPIEAVAMADAALTAFSLTGDVLHFELLHRTHSWFHGSNSVGLALADPMSGACCDGLGTQGLNRNQGAESTLAFLWTQVHLGEAVRVAARTARSVPGLSPAIP
jgi:hypothetical protein